MAAILTYYLPIVNGSRIFCGFQVIGGDGGQEALFHFAIREVQQESVAAHVIVLDSQVAALVNHGQGLLYRCLERSAVIFHAGCLPYISSQVAR